MSDPGFDSNADSADSSAADEMGAVVEAILFVASEPVSRAKLIQVFGEDEEIEARAHRAIDAVIERWRERPASGVMIDEVAGGLRLVTRPELHADLRRFFEVSGSNKLSMPALETLAIVAYRQPVTAPEIQELRGVNSSGVLKTLLERRMVRIAGRKEVVGKPFLYATTREFLMHFGLRHLSELPPLEQFEEMLAADTEAGDTAPDAEEEILQTAAALDEAEDAEAEAAEAEAIEQERADAEAEQAAAEEDDPELAGAERELGGAEAATVWKNEVSENEVLKNEVSENEVSENAAAENETSENAALDETVGEGSSSEGDDADSEGDEPDSPEETPS